MTVRWDIFRYYCPKCFNAFLLETKNGEKEFYKTKKEICDVYGISLAVVNHGLIGFPLCLDGENRIWIRYKTCKDCADYMLESKNCYKTKNCLYK